MTTNSTVTEHTDSRGITHLTLSRPATHNAFDDLMIAQLHQTLNRLALNRTTRVLVLAGEGRSFSAGADLNWMNKTLTYSDADNQHDAEKLARMLNALNEFPAPTIACVHGAAFGGGVGLVACCDIAIAATSAKFSLAEVKLGLIPATISPFVIAAIGSRAARRYFLTAERFDAAAALSMGLVHETVAGEMLDSRTNDFIEMLLQCSPTAQCSTKELIRAVNFRPVDDQLLTDTAKRIAAARASKDGREGIQAFLDKRAPDWIPQDV